MSDVGGYLLRHERHGEAERLRTLERVCDPETIGHLRRIGVGAGWSCLEVGAGHGSIARWLGRVVGDTGRVMATDIDIRLLGYQPANVEVVRHDVERDLLDPESFDLVHTRFVLEHLPSRASVVEKLVSALRPGGWLLIEESDWTSVASSDERPVFDRVTAALREVLVATGYDAGCGRKVPALLRSAGLDSIEVTGRASLDRDCNRTRWLQLVEALRPQMLARDPLCAGDVADFQQLVAASDFDSCNTLVVSGSGRRPGTDGGLQ